MISLSLSLSLQRRRSYYTKHRSTWSLAQCNFGWFQSTNKPRLFTYASTSSKSCISYPVGVKIIEAKKRKRANM